MANRRSFPHKSSSVAVRVPVLKQGMVGNLTARPTSEPYTLRTFRVLRASGLGFRVEGFRLRVQEDLWGGRGFRPLGFRLAFSAVGVSDQVWLQAGKLKERCGPETQNATL